MDAAVLAKASQPCCSYPSLSFPSTPECYYRSAWAYFPLPTGGPACRGRKKEAVAGRNEPSGCSRFGCGSPASWVQPHLRRGALQAANSTACRCGVTRPPGAGVCGGGGCLRHRIAAPAQKPQDARLPALGRGGGGRGLALQSGNSLKRVTRLRWEEIWPLGNRGSHSCFSLKMDSPSAEKALGSRWRCAAPVSCGEPCRHPDPQEPSLLPSRTQQGSLTSCSFREPLTSPHPALHAGEALSTSSKEAYFLYNSDCAKGLLKTDDAHIRTLSHSHYWWYVKKKLNLFGGDFDIYEFTIITPYVPTIFKFSLYDALKIFTTTLLHLLQF